MIRALAVILSSVILLSGQTVDFNTHFTGQTLRWDYFHSGVATEEHISMDQVRLEGPWPGSRIQLIDDTNLGKFLFEVVDPATEQVLYSRASASIYGEYETTGPAHEGIWGTMHESQRFPEPKQPVRLVLKKRQDDGSFAAFHSVDVDPKSRFVDRSAITPTGKVWSHIENGPAAVKVDLLVLGDGYTKKEMKQFHKDVERLMGVLFDTEPFKSRKGDFNVWAIDVVAAESGISNPRMGVWRDNPLGCSYNSMDSDRYVLTYANRRVRDISAQAPYDAVVILINDRKYGGGGIYNLYTTAATGSNQAPYLVVHEFGHSFGSLGDEYYTSPTAYEEFNPPGVEPWEPNITALLDPTSLKWWHLMDTDTPLPTPWEKAAYDSTSYAYQEKRKELREAGASEEEMEVLFAEVRNATKSKLEAEEYYGKVGAFEGAGYEPVGLYRPEVDCIMFSRNRDDFCRVCAEAIERVIDLYVK